MADLGGSAAQNTPSRRDFLKRSTAMAAGATLAGGLTVARSAHAAGSDLVRIALIGAGGRGTGAAVEALNNKSYPNVKLVAVADAFQNRAQNSLGQITRRCKDKVDVPAERVFVGLDCHEKAIACGCDMVLLCGPPGFRPQQFEAAVKAGKHVFMEKPVCTDGPGYRRIVAANAEAKKKNLLVAVGHHLRHEDKHREVIKRIHDGLIGRVMYMLAYFNSTGVWSFARQPNEPELQYQVRNWYYYTWLSGDHIVEQHVHDLDVCNWMMKDQHPVEANGMGGREVRKGPQYGEIFDHHAVEFTYADGTRMFSQCRHIPGTWQSFSEHAYGTKGCANIEGHGDSQICVTGEKPLRWKRTADGHQIEHDDLFAALAAGKPYNEGDHGADASMTAVLGRMATYSGKVVKWDEAVKSELDLSPKTFAWNAETPVKPLADGTYACAVPGVTKAW
jgi:predicted dehydrogenase